MDSPETTGSNLLVQHQRLMLEHYGHKHTAVLPDDVIQRLLLGVSLLLFILWTPIVSQIPLNPHDLHFTDFNLLFILVSLQSTRTLELALHLEQKVIKLKQDALHLMNVALAGTACGQILSLFEYAFGYPESKESRERGKELEELEHHFETDEESPDEEFTISKAEDVVEAAGPI